MDRDIPRLRRIISVEVVIMSLDLETLLTHSDEEILFYIASDICL